MKTGIGSGDDLLRDPYDFTRFWGPLFQLMRRTRLSDDALLRCAEASSSAR